MTTLRLELILELRQIQHNRPDLSIHDKKRKEITLIEVGITNIDLLNQAED